MTATERRRWLAERQSGIGATDISSIAGTGFQSAQDVYAEKVAPEPIDRPPLPIMKMGLATEALNAELYSRRFDCWLSEPGLVRSREREWMLATFDRIAERQQPEATNAYRAVELKYTRWFGDSWGDDGSDQIPDSYSIQATWQHAILLSKYPSRKIDPPHVAALDSSGEQRVFTVQYSERLAALLFELAEEFWIRVQRREEVGPDWNHPLRQEITETLIAIRPETAMSLGDEHVALIDEIERLSATRRLGEQADKQSKTLKAKLRSILGEYESGILPDGRRVKQGLCQNAGYTVEPFEYRTVKIYPPKKTPKGP